MRGSEEAGGRGEVQRQEAKKMKWQRICNKKRRDKNGRKGERGRRGGENKGRRGEAERTREGEAERTKNEEKGDPVLEK